MSTYCAIMAGIFVLLALLAAYRAGQKSRDLFVRREPRYKAGKIDFI